MKWMLGIAIGLWACLTWAQASEDDQQDSFININMTLEVEGIEDAIQNTNQSLDHIGDALEQIAQSNNLTPEQQSLLGDTIASLNQLVHLSKDSVESLPQAFQQSRQAISTESRRFLDDLQLKVIIAISAIGLLLLSLIAAIGWFILRPLQSSLVSVTQNVSSMAGSINTTAQALDSISKQQHDIAQRLDRSKQEMSEPDKKQD